MKGSEEIRRRLADRVEETVPALCDRYLAALRADASPLCAPPDQGAAARDHAEAILLDVVRALREGPPDGAGQADSALVLEIPDPHTVLSYAPMGDVLRAMAVLTELVLERIDAFSGGLPDADRRALRARAAFEVHRAVALHGQLAAAGRDSQLLLAMSPGSPEDERRDRLSDEIHDRVGGGLALARRHLDLYLAKSSAGLAADDHMDAVERSLRDAAESVRRLVSGAPEAAAPADLEASLRQDAAVLNSRGAAVHITVTGDDGLLPAHHRAELFLSLREFVRNSLRHAEPSEVRVRVEVTAAAVTAEAGDDGTGFDPELTVGAPRGGLRTMRRRVVRLGGSYALTSAPGEGTRLRLRVPLPTGDGAGGPWPHRAESR
ncbi:sensor histidine kinase [Allonocardiopsis opalescens]|uniref:Histidine kinase/DNA gyrase B/HSP90-like ATPase n=1 Tax=Allonocardiopsis opalescens TaxID=1144618 RepID=A0A2T0PV10_9ACTN|nr:ATP-binding protein [Allonocardiopsis opalescens]PRX92566.1 histidine kinase/DNA gyrase B/HSP90-like ATPase [Allonocardiopsis opalescens]